MVVEDDDDDVGIVAAVNGTEDDEKEEEEEVDDIDEEDVVVLFLGTAFDNLCFTLVGGMLLVGGIGKFVKTGRPVLGDLLEPGEISLVPGIVDILLNDLCLCFLS